MISRIALNLILLILAFSRIVVGEETDAPLTLNEILARADSVSSRSDSILTNNKYSFESYSIFERLNKDGSIKNIDTTDAVVTMRGTEELSREIIYSSSGDDGNKKTKREEKRLSLSFDNPEYDFTLIGSDESSYTISVDPKTDPPGEGLYKGTIEIDRSRFFLKRFDFVIPNPEGALREFSIEMNFELLEGELVVPVDMRMTGFVKALLGIIKVRFSGETRFSDYKLLQ